jgi:hypothetical protein
VIVAIGYAPRDTSLSARLQSNPVPTRTTIEAWLDAAWPPLVGCSIAVVQPLCVANLIVPQVTVCARGPGLVVSRLNATSSR